MCKQRNDYSKGSHRYEQAWPTPIAVKTLPNGYQLDMKGEGYVYFSAEELIKGLIVRLGLGVEGVMSQEDTNQLVRSLAKGTALKEAIREKAELKRTIAALQREIRKLKRGAK